MSLPIDDLLVRIVGTFRTERRIADKAFEHDGAKGPPVAFVAIALKKEDLWCDVVGRPDGRVGLRNRRLVSFRVDTQKPEEPTSFLRLAFQVAMVSLLVIVKWMALTITLFLVGLPPVDAVPLALSNNR